MIEAREIMAEVDAANQIVISSHFSPDGDSIGSSVALFRMLHKQGKKVTICHADPAPDSLAYLLSDVLFYSYKLQANEVTELMANADLILCLDYNASSRVGADMEPLLLSSPARKILIDHHPHPDNFAEIVASYPKRASTSELIYELIDGAGKVDLIDKDIAMALYTGIVTDTGSFRYSQVIPRTHEIAARLLDTGFEHAWIHEHLFDNNQLNVIRMRGFVMSERLQVNREFGLGYIALSKQDMDRFECSKGDTDGLVNMALGISEVRVAAFFVEHQDHIKVSMRSKGSIAVNTCVVELFNGGGHRNAAGGVSYLSLTESVDKLLSNYRTYFTSQTA